MKTRYKKYSDYGMTDVDVANTNDYLNHLTDEECIELADVIQAGLPEHVGMFVSMALIYGCGYGYLCKRGLMYDKPDFYGYKRKGISIVYQYRKGKDNEINNDGKM